jgi:predicted Zn-dependent protease
MLRASLILLAAAWAGMAYAAESIDGVTPDMEARQSARGHLALVAQLGGEYTDRGIATYVAGIGQRLIDAAGSDAAPFSFTFTVLDTPGILAFAQPGGYVYISRAVLALANSEAEVAAVLAHEMGHVILRHGSHRQSVLREMTGRPRRDINDAANALNRAQELAADAVSVPLLAAAGYDPATQARFLTTMDAQLTFEVSVGMRLNRDAEKDAQPTVAERLARLGEAVTALPGSVRSATWRDGRAEHGAAVDGMIFGFRPNQGMVSRARYVDAASRITFDIPNEYQFRLGNALAADGPNGAVLQIDARRMPAEMDMGEYLRSVVADGTEFHAVETGYMDGLRAALANAEAGAEAKREYFILGAIRTANDRVMRFHFAKAQPFNEAEVAAARAAIISFRCLTAAEAQGWQPLRISVLAVSERTTLDAIAAQMDMPRAMDWLLRLNALEPKAELRAGDVVKVVR